LLDAAFTLGEEVVKFACLEIAKLFLLIEVQDGGGDHVFAAGIFA
jgi:hypothetical protein